MNSQKTRETDSDTWGLEDMAAPWANPIKQI